MSKVYEGVVLTLALREGALVEEMSAEMCRVLRLVDVEAADAETVKAIIAHEMTRAVRSMSARVQAKLIPETGIGYDPDAYRDLMAPVRAAWGA